MKDDLQKFNVGIKYKAQGFVESLIAVAITGLAGVLLLSVSIRTIDQTLDNEVYDEVTNGSSVLSKKLSYLVDVHNFGNIDPDDDPVLRLIDFNGMCFDLGNKFVSDITDLDIESVCPLSMSKGKLDRDACGLTGEIGAFNFVCVNSNSNKSILSVDIVSGDSGCTDESCKDFVDKEIYLLK